MRMMDHCVQISLSSIQMGITPLLKFNQQSKLKHINIFRFKVAWIKDNSDLLTSSKRILQLNFYSRTYPVLQLISIFLINDNKLINTLSEYTGVCKMKHLQTTKITI